MGSLKACMNAFAAAVVPATLGMLTTSAAQAYVGPGAGLTAIGAVLAVIAAVFLAIVGFIWYPVRRHMRNRRAATAKAEEANAEK